MRHRHVTVTLEAATVDRIETRLESGETVSDWIAEAARRQLEAEDGEREPDDRPRVEFVDDCAI